MKLVLIASLFTALFASGAQAGLAQKLASVNQLERDANQFAEMIGENQDCAMKVQRHQGGIRVAMKSENTGYAWLDVAYDNAVVLTEQYADDGSYRKVYEIPSQGRLVATVADDSYFHASLESHGKTISCEIDF